MEFERPWLIQRCYLRDDGTLNFEYMGSSEFEFGIIPKTLARISEQDLVIHKLEVDLMESKVAFFIYGLCDRDWRPYLPILLGLVDGSVRTLEPTMLKEELEFSLKLKEPRQYQSRRNIWLDLRNDCFFSLSNEKIDQLHSLWEAAANGDIEWSRKLFAGSTLKITAP